MTQFNLIQGVVPANITNNIQSSNNRTDISETKQSFATVLKSAINEVNDAQIQSDATTTKLAIGENIELHDVMISAQKASITLQAALEIRNKAVEAYQEIMRMQV